MTKGGHVNTLCHMRLSCSRFDTHSSRADSTDSRVPIHGVTCDCRVHALILIAVGLTVQTAGWEFAGYDDTSV